MIKWLYGFSDVVLDEDIKLISKYIVIKDKNGKVVVVRYQKRDRT